MSVFPFLWCARPEGRPVCVNPRPTKPASVSLGLGGWLGLGLIGALTSTDCNGVGWGSAPPIHINTPLVRLCTGAGANGADWRAGLLTLAGRLTSADILLRTLSFLRFVSCLAPHPQLRPENRRININGHSFLVFVFSSDGCTALPLQSSMRYN